MKKVYVFVCLLLCSIGVSAQLYWNTNGVGNTLTATNWGTVPAGPFTTAWTNGSNINFTANSSITNVTNIPVGNLTITNGSLVTWTPTGTFSTGAGIRTFDIGAGSTLTWNGQTVSTAAGTGFIKNGAGVWNIGAQGNAYTAGFTMNAGTIIIGGNNALGTGPLTINGGILSPSSTTARTPNVSGTTIGGDFQFGDVVNFSTFTGNITLANAVSLGAAANRKITIGNTGTYSLNGIISGAGSSLTVDSIPTATGILALGGVNTYNGGTTLTGGTLQLGAAGALPTSGTLTFNGGTLRTGSGAGFAQSTGTLALTNNSTLRFGTGAHSLNFLNSSAVSWTAGKMLTITGWTGGYNGTAGTAGRIFVGTDATGLTAGQLAQIQFFNGTSNFPASILSTGEVVAGVAGGTPDIALSSPSPAVAAGNILQGSTSATNNPIYRFDLAVTTSAATLTGVTITTAGTYAASDITNFKCWYSSDAVFSPGTDILLSTKTTGLGAGAQVFPSFTNQVIANGSTGYFFITADVPCAAVVGNNISVNAIATTDLTFTSGNVTGSSFAGGLQTISAATPNNVTAPAASVANSSSNLTWTNPTGCYTEVMIVGSAGAPNSGTPTGDGTAYTGSLVFGTGTALGNGFVLYKGNTSGQLVTGLTNGTTYYYKFFTRFGTTWTAGVEVNATPASVTSATDYFRSAASGAWATLATWESSNDSTNWIPATLIPGAGAAHVVVRSPDSVWLTTARTTANLTIMSGAKFNATTFSVTATSRFNLLGTASFYQGGTSTVVPGVGVEQVLAPTSNYHYNGTQAGTSASAYPAFGNFIWEPTASGAGTFQNTISTAPFNLGLVIRGDMTINLQNVSPTEIRFATGSSTTRSHTIDGNLNIISANSKVVITNGGIPVLSTVTVGGNINISAGILQGTSSTAGTDGSGILNLKGNINNTGGTIQTGTSTAGIFSLNYVGTGAQSINNTGGTFSFTANQKDTINNSAGLTLNTPITHKGTIQFINGIVTTTSTNLLTMDAGSVVLGASNASYVSGPVKKTGNTPFEFPIGKSGTGMVPFAVSNFAGTLDPVNDAFTAEYFRASAYTVGATISDPMIHHISACDYWRLDRTGAQTADITAYWNSNNPCNGTPYVDDLSKIQIVHYDGANWNSSSTGFGGTTGTIANGTRTWPAVNTFSPFALGSTTYGANPLPISINYFTGTKQNSNHLLNWKVTCNSTPSVTMLMERSSDGRNYNSIYSINATALQCQQPFTYTDAQPAAGINYYRLKMTDADGKITYSTVVSLINAAKGFDVLNIAPNPIVNGRFNLNISAAQNAGMNMLITDMQGRVLQQQSVNLVAGFNSIPVNVTTLAAGTYQVYGITAEGRTRVLRFVIQ